MSQLRSQFRPRERSHTFLHTRGDPEASSRSLNPQRVLDRLASLIPHQPQAPVVAVHVEIPPRIERLLPAIVVVRVIKIVGLKLSMECEGNLIKFFSQG